MKPEIQVLVAYRLEQADEALQATQILIEFELRQESDYQELVPISVEQAQEISEHARLFLAGVKEQLQQTITKEEQEDGAK